MSRLQKKCLIASAGVHLLLFSILLVGPAFLSTKPPPVEDLPLIDFIPLRTTDELMSGGGNPNANSAPPSPRQEPPPQPAPQQPQQPQRVPEPAPPRRTEPEPVKEAPKEPLKPAEPAADVADQKPKRDFKLVPITRKQSSESSKQAQENERAAQRSAQARRKALQELGRTAELIGNGLSAGTSVELRGPGGGGVPYANFLQAVQTIYQRAWKGRVPAGATDHSTTAIAAVTIARDGTVLNARIIERSGNSRVDNAVQSTLDYIRHTVPLPEEAKESQRTVTISFDVEAKKGLG